MTIARSIGAALALGLLTLANGASAADVTVGKLVIEAPWTRATPAGAKVGAGYLSIINTGSEGDTLLAATSPIAERVEIHESSMAGGIMRMRRLEQGLDLKPKSVTEMKPGGYHIMLIGLKQPIAEGATVPLEVTFKQAGKVRLTLTAAGIGATAAPGRDRIETGGSNSGTAPAQRKKIQ